MDSIRDFLQSCYDSAKIVCNGVYKEYFFEELEGDGNVR